MVLHTCLVQSTESTFHIDAVKFNLICIDIKPQKGFFLIQHGIMPRLH